MSFIILISLQSDILDKYFSDGSMTESTAHLLLTQLNELRADIARAERERVERERERVERERQERERAGRRSRKQKVKPTQACGVRGITYMYNYIV